MNQIDEIREVGTGSATLAIFDHEVAAGWAPADEDPIHQIPEVARGDIALFSTEAEGAFQVRLTDGELTDDERAYAVRSYGPLGLKVVSGGVLILGGEEIDGLGGYDTRTLLDHQIAVPPGQYDLTVFFIDWAAGGRWIEDGWPAEDAPPDYVLQLRPRRSPFTAPASEPAVSCIREPDEPFLFPDLPRQLGPLMGVTLQGQVTRPDPGSPSLVLDVQNPWGYEVDTSGLDLSPFQEGACLRVRIESIDSAAQTLRVEVLEEIEESELDLPGDF